MGKASKLLHGNAKFPLSKVENSEPSSLFQRFPPLFYVAQTPWLTMFSFPLCYPHEAWLRDILRGPCARTTRKASTDGGGGYSQPCVVLLSQASGCCSSSVHVSPSSGRLFRVSYDFVGPILSQTDFSFFTFSNCHLTFVSSLLAVTLWLFGNCQLVFHTSPRKTSLRRVSLWPSPLLNDLQSQAEINWRYLFPC